MKTRNGDIPGVRYARQDPYRFEYEQRGRFRSDPVAIILGTLLFVGLVLLVTCLAALTFGMSVPML